MSRDHATVPTSRDAAAGPDSTPPHRPRQPVQDTPRHGTSGRLDPLHVHVRHVHVYVRNVTGLPFPSYAVRTFNVQTSRSPGLSISRRIHRDVGDCHSFAPGSPVSGAVGGKPLYPYPGRGRTLKSQTARNSARPEPGGERRPPSPPCFPDIPPCVLTSRPVRYPPCTSTSRYPPCTSGKMGTRGVAWLRHGWVDVSPETLTAVGP